MRDDAARRSGRRQNRNSGPRSEEYDTTNNLVHHNTILGPGKSGTVADYGNAFWQHASNRFDHNIYRVRSLPAYQFAYGDRWYDFRNARHVVLGGHRSTVLL